MPRWKENGFSYAPELPPNIQIIAQDFEIPQRIKTRCISALLPHDYDQTEHRYPVFYLQDGQNLFDDHALFGNWAVDKKLAILTEPGPDDLILIATDPSEEERIRLPLLQNWKAAPNIHFHSIHFGASFEAKIYIFGSQSEKDITFSSMNIAIQHSLEENSDTIVIPVAGPAERESALGPIAEASELQLDRLLQDFGAEPGEIHTVYGPKNKRFFLLGLGEKPGFGETLKAFRSFSHKCRKKLPSQISICFLTPALKGAGATLVEAAVNGLRLGTYQIGRFKTEAAEQHPLSDPAARLVLIVDPEDSDAAHRAALSGKAVADTQMSVFNLVNAPSNKKLPSDLAEWVRRSGAEHGYGVCVMDKAEIEKTGLHALLAVNQGSAHDPVFIIMEYRPENNGGKPLKKVGLVGKGITFDTGGLSIKPSTNMYLMKSDMGGAAAVFGALEATARLKLPVHLIGIVPATDNSVDAKAIKPSDVINSYSGKTIEIIDTDAEGRLILADGIFYMVKHFQPDVLIDLATLTGSTVRTLGYHAAGLFCNDDAMAEQLSESSLRTGERLWRLPLWDVYKEDLKSDVADVRNFSGKPIAGAIGAAKFLEVFSDGHPAWAHLDIAGVAFQDSEFSSQKSATGFGVRLLLDYLKKISG